MGQVNLGRVIGPSGANGTTPHIGADGNWHIGEQNTGVKAQGVNGATGMPGNNGANGITPHIGANGNWCIGSSDTGIKAQGTVGANGITPHIGANGNWFVGETDTGTSASNAIVRIKDLSEFSSEIFCLRDVIEKIYSTDELNGKSFSGTIKLYVTSSNGNIICYEIFAYERFNLIEFKVVDGLVRYVKGVGYANNSIKTYGEYDAKLIEAVTTGTADHKYHQTVSTFGIMAEVLLQR